MVGEYVPAAAPPRGTRPSNRRELILDAAGRLFADKGYAHVAMSDVADAVNVAPSAIYRHFPGKSALLFDAVADGLQRFDALVLEAPMGDFDEFLAHLTAAALDLPHLGVLWQRESRTLSGAERAKLRGLVRSSMQRATSMVRTLRPDLTPRHAELFTAGIVAMLTSIGFHRVDLPRTKYRALLEEMAHSIITVDPGTVASRVPIPREPQLDRSRREQLLNAAVDLFSQRGFNAVSIDDIGAVLGIAGPSLYHHFESKQQLLAEALDRANEILNWRVEQALEDVDSELPPLRRISDAYVNLAIDHSAVISMLITESGHLDPVDVRRTRQTQRMFVDQWVVLARETGRREAVAATRIRVQAAQMMANDLCRTHHLHTIPGFRSLVQELCWAVQR